MGETLEDIREELTDCTDATMHTSLMDATDVKVAAKVSS